MKEFRLSTPAERLSGVCFTAAMICMFAVLLYALRASIRLLIFSGLCVAGISALLIVYVCGVLRASVVVDAEKKLLHIKGIQNDTLDLKDAVLLQTFARKSGQTTVRVLVFSDSEEQIIATVSTMFTFRQGIWADPVAREIAAELGIEFKQNVPDWQLDKKKYQEHIKEEAEREKAEAKKRRQKKMELRIQKYKKQK